MRSHSGPIAFHFTARTLAGTRPFLNPVRCQQLWSALRAEFPRCYAAVIMPNHFHLVIPGNAESARLQWRQGVAMRSVSRTQGPELVRWCRAPVPQLLVDRTKAQTVLRYVHLNPVRARLTGDPLSWRWSTLLDVVLPNSPRAGWLDRAALAALHGQRDVELARLLLRFTLNDSFCSDRSRDPLLPWSDEQLPTQQRIRQALQVLELDHSPQRVRANMVLRRQSVRTAARAIQMSESGARKALTHVSLRNWEETLSLLHILLANPRLASAPCNQSLEVQGSPQFFRSD